MSGLEIEVDELRSRLNAIADRVRIGAAAEAFMRGEHPIRRGDYFLVHHEFPSRLDNVSSEGKWTYQGPSGYIEPHRIPEPGEHSRLYTIAEVAEIVQQAVAKVAKAVLSEVAQ